MNRQAVAALAMTWVVVGCGHPPAPRFRTRTEPVGVVRGSAARFVALVAPSTLEPRCEDLRNVPGASGNRLVSLVYGDPPERRVAVRLNASDEPTGYSDLRGDLNDSDGHDGAQTAIGIDFVRGQAFAGNRREDGTALTFRIPLKEALTSPNLDRPRRLIDRVMATCLGRASAAPAQMETSRHRDQERSRAVAAEWHTVAADSAALASLLARSRDDPGPELLRALVATATDSTRPGLVRLDALSLIPSYITPEEAYGVMEYLLDPNPYRMHGSVDHASYGASSSIEPILRDTVRVAVRALAASTQDSILRLAAGHLSRLIGKPLQERMADAGCTRPAGGQALAKWELLRSFTAMRSCPELLVELWKGVGPDSVAIAALFEGTQELRDRRLPPVLDEVARDEERPFDARWAALQVMATLAHPRMYTMSPRSLDAFGDHWCVHWGWASHDAVQEEGPEPMGAEGRSTVLDLLADQARTNPDTRLRRGAEHLHACVVRLSLEQPTPRGD